MVSFLFNLRKNNSSSSVLDDDLHDEHVCLHVSVGDPCCSSCYHQQQFTSNKRKRHSQQHTLKNKKTCFNNNWKDEEQELKSSSVCLHLLLSSPSCIPTCIHQPNNNNVAAAAADDHDHDHQWEMKKVLEDSDVRHHLCRLLIKKDLAQQFIIPVLMLDAAAEQAARSKDGIHVQIRDVDTDSLHTLAFKIWSSAKSHIFAKTWIQDFVLRRELKKGDQIGLCWDQGNNRFDFSVLRRAKKD